MVLLQKMPNDASLDAMPKLLYSKSIGYFWQRSKGLHIDNYNNYNILDIV
jgi:hypothetical protein